MKTIYKRPYLLFLAVAAVALLVAINYFNFSPDAYFDLGGDYEFTVPSYLCWFIFSGYCLVLSGIYFTAVKGKLKMKSWLVISHFVFIVLFLLLFFAFNSFNTSYVQDHISGLPFFTLVAIYGIIFLLDVTFFVVGIVLLVVNIFTFKRPDRP